MTCSFGLLLCKHSDISDLFFAGEDARKERALFALEVHSHLFGVFAEEDYVVGKGECHSVVKLEYIREPVGQKAFEWVALVQTMDFYFFAVG
jgi:hypothetical protein